MHELDKEQDFSEEEPSDEDFTDHETFSKRKLRQRGITDLKKVKYEDITDKNSKKKQKNELYKPPTVEELNELKETQNLYNNNLFRLQIEELVKEINIKNKHCNAFSEWLELFLAFIVELPEFSIPLSHIKKNNDKKVSKINKLTKELAKVSIEYDQDFTLKFMKPESYEIFGLNSINALPGPELEVNINLKIPRSCFNVKDYLNNRYFVRRYYYLAYILHFMKEKNLGADIQWTYHNYDKLLPILIIKVNEKVSVKIFTSPVENYFKFSRFTPEVNNVKTNVFKSGNIIESPTIFYNSSLAHDITLSVNNSFIKENLADFPNIQEAIKLIYVWLVQRSLNVGFGSFTEDLILYFITYLCLKKRINKHMSSYQVVRNFWNFLNESDLSTNSISLADDVKAETLEAFRKNFELVFLDRTGCYNVTSFLSLDFYKKIKFECKLAFKLLDDSGINSFHSLFISKLPVELQYDLILNLKSETNFDNIIKKMTDPERTKFLGHPEMFVRQYILEILHKGFNKRASLIAPILEENYHFGKMSFAINLKPSEAFSILEKGPALNDPQEKEFKEFWGELSTDRRFKDGSICVAVYFKTETIKERRDIIKTIINWIATKKLELEYNLFYNEFEEVLINKKVSASYPMGTNEECCLKVIAASDDLGKKLRSLEIPLTVTGVQGISDTFTMTEVFPPISTNYKCGKKITKIVENNIGINEKRIGVVPKYVKPVECVLQLEHSSKWPKDLETLRHMKTAFYLEISKQLSKKHKLVTSVRPHFFDVLYEGYVFRYRLYLSREVGLLKKESTNNGIITYKDTPESEEMEMRLHILPQLTGALKGLQAQYPSFGPATALIKRWLRSQLLDNYHMPDDVINLVNASLYLNQTEFDIPATPQIGFLRFLKFFSELQWDVQPVLVNLNDEITNEKIAEIDSKLLKNREACPNLFIATPYDKCESLFTRTVPSKEVLRRIKQLSKESLDYIAQIVRKESLTTKNLFIANLEDYDVIINLRPLLNPLRHEQVNVDEIDGQIVLQAFDAKESTKVPVTGFNPVQCYLRELRSNYADFATFFHDTYGGNVIGVLWIPKALENKEFKVPHVNGRKLMDGKLALNTDALIEDFYILGKGLVKSIDKRK